MRFVIRFTFSVNGIGFPASTAGRPVMAPSLRIRLQELLHPRHVIGPTEATIAVTCQCEGGRDQSKRFVQRPGEPQIDFIHHDAQIRPVRTDGMRRSIGRFERLDRRIARSVINKNDLQPFALLGKLGKNWDAAARKDPEVDSRSFQPPDRVEK